ncbi:MULTISPECIES: TetR/AcrR family transcriptional regulator [unclassified Polaromonas]|uniref:TetR/AcrR family transcriptional regulator n=1 Tax=unclassified Polaromonas TaxID=2638319 RepID=UPI000F08C3C1|nr:MULTISPECIES: TetR/AcrR family transcriptional regulator [unclassified Polaromonas]AYQ28204.1 TetR/AcrR family transcriptional regulator [Polaromonas sp. SP1]QGJ16932.1 TetR family transcriptional regulator [Polaromonas sp. Pch-P]
MSTSPTPQNKRPGGRSAQVQFVVRKALEELIAQEGRDKVTVPAVAERAGVSASSIYRRWGDVNGLLDETASNRLDPNRPLPETGDLKAELTAWAQELITHLNKPGNASLLKAAAALAGSEETNCLKNRRNEATVLVQRAQARGDATPTVQQVLDHMMAPIIYRLIFGAGVEPELAGQLADELFVLANPNGPA